MDLHEIFVLNLLILFRFFYSYTALVITTPLERQDIANTGFVDHTMTITPTVPTVTCSWERINFDGTVTNIVIDSITYLSTGVGNIFILGFSPSLAGFYRCLCSNGIESAYSPKVLIVIQGTSTITPASEMSAEVTPSGQSFTLSCSFSPPDPAADVSWLHNDTSGVSNYVNEADTVKYSGSTATDPSLTINSMTADDLGEYWCQVTTVAGISSSEKITLIESANATLENAVTEQIVETTSYITTGDITTAETALSTIVTTDFTTTGSQPPMTSTDFLTTTEMFTTELTSLKMTTTDLISTTVTSPEMTTTTELLSTRMTSPEMTTTTEHHSTEVTSPLVTTDQTTLSPMLNNTARKGQCLRHQDRQVTVGLITTVLNLRTPVSCCSTCIRTSLCNSFNYQNETGTCQLAQSTLPDAMANIDWDYYIA